MDASLRARAEELAGDIAGQAKTAEDLNGLMRLMMKSAMERMLDTEMDVHLGRRSSAASADLDSDEVSATESSTPMPKSRSKRTPNRRNGRSRKTVQGDIRQQQRVSHRFPCVGIQWGIRWQCYCGFTADLLRLFAGVSFYRGMSPGPVCGARCAGPGVLNRPEVIKSRSASPHR